MNRPFAVEAKPSQIKKLGWTSNGYIVQGSGFLHVYGGERGMPGVVACTLTTRGKPTVVYLEPTTESVSGFDPRPSRAPGWEKNPAGQWEYERQEAIAAYRQQLELELQKKFRVGIGDCTTDERVVSAYDAGQNPAELADEIGEKLDIALPDLTGGYGLGLAAVAS